MILQNNMKYLGGFSLIVILLFHLSCNRETIHSEIKEYSSVDLLNYANITPGVFSDQGAWFGIDFPADKQLGIGNVLILSDSNGYNLSEPLIILSIEKDYQPFHIDIIRNSLPGSLFQSDIGDELKITIEAIYTDHQTVLIRYHIYNLVDTLVNFKINWEIADFNIIINNNSFKYKLDNAQMQIDFDKNYQISGNTAFRDEIINAQDTLNGLISIRHRFNSEEYDTDHPFMNAENKFLENHIRWRRYLQPFQNLSDQKQLLAAKCIQTLITNWRNPEGELTRAGLFPSYAYRGFHGLWAWDSWKHAVALASIEPGLAKDQIRAMYDFQNDKGMIADCIFRDTLLEKHNWRNTKPPLSAWAIYEVYQETYDTSFVIEMLPSLIKYHEWWYMNRDHDQNGLCEYGSTDGTRIAAAWESGMDNAVRFDSAEMIFSKPDAWSLNQESIDLNSYLYAEKKYLIKLAKITEQIEIVDEFEKQLPILKYQMQKVFYNTDHGYFFDIRTADQSHIEVVGPEAWIALWAEVATPEQAREIVSKIMDSTHFNTYLPFPSLSASHTEFDPENGYWRGPVWIDQAYFALEGMKKYGFVDEYNQMKEKLFRNAAGLLMKQMPIHENYDPRNGEALNAAHFSWSAAHFLLLLEDEN
jgi:putative isomerase